MSTQITEPKQVESEELTSNPNINKRIKDPYWKFNSGKVKKISKMKMQELYTCKSHANKKINYYYNMLEFFCLKEDQIDEELEKRNES